MFSKIIRLLRWILFIPVALVLSIIYAIYVHPFLTQGLDKKVAHALNTFMFSVISILLAYVIVPKHKFKVVLAFSGILLLIPVIGVYISASGIKLDGEDYTIIDGGVAMSMLIVGVIIGVFVVWSLKTWREEVLMRGKTGNDQ